MWVRIHDFTVAVFFLELRSYKGVVHVLWGVLIGGVLVSGLPTKERAGAGRGGAGAGRAGGLRVADCGLRRRWGRCQAQEIRQYG